MAHISTSDSAQSPDAALKPLLTVRDLSVEYRTKSGRVRAVDHVSFDINAGEVFGLAGESGCGKSTIAHAITRLLKPPAYTEGGDIRFQGRNVLELKDDALRAFRWEHVAIVFQSAMNALNPILTIGDQIVDVIRAHTGMSTRQARARALELLQVVGIDAKRIDSYPHQLSGGMRQRTVIATALALNPELIVMDEPTTALDVVVQKQIIDELQQLKKQFGFSILFITHDLSLLVEISDRIGIMYAGELVEIATARQLFKNPRHPYTQRLMNSFPSIHGAKQEMLGIPGSPPDLIHPPTGCRFHPRCSKVIAGVCREIHPQLIPLDATHAAACHLVNEGLHDAN